MVSFSLLQLIAIFIAAAMAVWFAGIALSDTTDIIDHRFGLGQALGGLIFLAITTNLPEIAIVTSASLTHHMDIAIGNILGGIAIQTVVLALIDGIGLREKSSLTYKAASLQLVLEGVLVIAVLTIVIMGAELPQALIYARLAPCDLLIAVVWIMGVWLINKARTGLPWHKKANTVSNDYPARTINRKKYAKYSNFKIFLIFTFSSIVTLVAGVLLELSGSGIAAQIGWSGVLFGATILALATSLPEISTGLQAVKIGDYTLAVSDIFGGNAFLPVLFLPATLMSGQSILPQASRIDIYLASLSVLLTSIYIYGLIFRNNRQIYWLGIDSIIVVITYFMGIAGLFVISNS